MDAAVSGAITAVRLDPGTAKRWFDLITTVHSRAQDSGAGDDWESFQLQFANAARDDAFRGELVVEFLRYLARHGRLDTVRQMRQIGSDLPVRYDQLLARRGGVADDDESDDDAYGSAQTRGPSHWDTVVERFGPGWAGWNGTEQDWVRFRDWLYAAANAEDPLLYAAAYERLDPLNAVGEAERVAVLRGFGFTVTV